MFIKTGGFIAALPPVNNTNVKKNDKVTHCIEVYDKGKKRVMCKSVRTNIWLLAKPSRISKRKV